MGTPTTTRRAGNQDDNHRQGRRHGQPYEGPTYPRRHRLRRQPSRLCQREVGDPGGKSGAAKLHHHRRSTTTESPLVRPHRRLLLRGEASLRPTTISPSWPGHQDSDPPLQLQRLPAADQRHGPPDGRHGEQVQARADDPGEVHHLQRCGHRGAADAEPDVHQVQPSWGV